MAISMETCIYGDPKYATMRVLFSMNSHFYNQKPCIESSATDGYRIKDTDDDDDENDQQENDSEREKQRGRKQTPALWPRHPYIQNRVFRMFE